MSVGETDGYVDDDDTSIYRWRIKMTINMFQEQVCSTNETFVSFLQSIFLQPYLRLFFSSSFSSSLLLPFYLPFPFDSSVTVSYSLIQFRPSSPPPSARSLDFHDVRKSGHNASEESLLSLVVARFANPRWHRGSFSAVLCGELVNSASGRAAPAFRDLLCTLPLSLVTGLTFCDFWRLLCRGRPWQDSTGRLIGGNLGFRAFTSHADVETAVAFTFVQDILQSFV